LDAKEIANGIQGDRKYQFMFGWHFFEDEHFFGDGSLRNIRESWMDVQ
jgi:hypothetical protein